MRGTIARWNRAKGFGFIQPDSAGPLHTSADDIFVHVSDITDGPEYLEPGMRVEFKLGPQRDGRTKAIMVRVIEEVPA